MIMRYPRTTHALLTGTLLIIASASAPALPRFSLLTGTRCSACHYDPHGGGLRTELGWSTMNLVGAIDPESIGLGGLYSGETNSFFDHKITVGFDGRLQMARTGVPPYDERIFIPMQFQPYLAYEPTDWLDIYGGYNLSVVMSNRELPGQFPVVGAVQVQTSPTAPIFRAGYISPAIGVRPDDHTVFVRREIARYKTTIIPPNYSELGGEVVYEGLKWLTVSGGVFSSHNLAETDPTIDPNGISYNGRIELWPRLLDEGINGQLGASVLVNGDFRMINAFAGFGLTDKATIYGEGMYSENADGQRVHNVSVIGTLQLANWLSLDWRYEFGMTETPADVWHANAFLVGFEFFPLPYIELRPEYRYFENDQYRTGEYTVQLHLFY